MSVAPLRHASIDSANKTEILDTSPIQTNMVGLENLWKVMDSTQADLTKMESSIEPTILPAAGVYASVATAVSETNNSQQKHQANVEIATNR
jgi:hypothetical protein